MKMLHALFSWHSETLSAWSMIAVVVAATLNYTRVYHNQNIAAFLVWFHVIIHAPFSIAYHCLHNEVVGDYDIRHAMWS